MSRSRTRKTVVTEEEGFTSEQRWPDGTTVEHVVEAVGEEFVWTSRRNGVESARQPIGPVSGGLLGALASAPQTLEVGTGVTRILTTGPVSIQDLLGALIVVDPDAPMLDADAWTEQVDDGSPVDVEDWLGQDEEMTAIRTSEGFELMPRWITINDDRGFVVRGEGFAAVGVVDPQSDWNRPLLTAGLLSWGFYAESGGPCTWDGGAELGWCGSRLWGFTRWGDVDPVQAVFPAPAADDLTVTVADWIDYLDWELPYLLAAVGTPGLDDADQEALGEADDVEGPWVSSGLNEAVDDEVVTLLCARYPDLRGAVDGLREPGSERGQLIYAWLRQVARGDYQSGSWNQVHAAMLGRIDPPADDQRAPTMSERWAENLRRAEAVIAQARHDQDPSDDPRGDRDA